MIDPVASLENVSPAVERLAIEAYRRMSAREKLRRVGELGRMVDALALADIRAKHPGATPEELRLHLAARTYDRETMLRFFRRDSGEHGT